MIVFFGVKFKCIILFVVFVGEEFGLLGVKVYVKIYVKELGKIVNLFNWDGGLILLVGIFVFQVMYDDFVEVCKFVKEICVDYLFEVKVVKFFKCFI